MKLEVWYNENTKEQLTLEPEIWGDYYLEIKKGTRTISGITRFWLFNNGFKKIV